MLKIGDKVKCISKDHGNYTVGLEIDKVYTVLRYEGQNNSPGYENMGLVEIDLPNTSLYYEENFERLRPKKLRVRDLLSV